MTLRIIATGGTFDKQYDAIRGQLTFKDTHLPDIIEQVRAGFPIALELNQLVDNLPGFAYQGLDAGGWTVAYLSEGFREITGYRPELFIGNLSLAYNDLILPSHRQAIRKKWDQVLADHLIFEEEYPITTASGTVKWIWERGRGIYDEEGHLQCVEGFATDISYRKRVEEALRATETQLRSYIDNSPIGVFICDEKGR